MGSKFRPKDSTDLRGYAIRISQGEVLFFNSEGILKSCSLKEAESMELQDLYRKSITGPWMLKRSYKVAGYNNKNAFKSAAARMRVGNTISDFYRYAKIECERQSSKPHKVVWTPEKYQFILDVHEPKVYRKKHYMRITVKFKINPTVVEGITPVARAMKDLETFVRKAKEQLYLVEDFKETPFEKLPEPCGLRAVSEEIVFEFRV